MQKPQVYRPPNPLEPALDARFAPEPEQLLNDARERISALRETLVAHVRREVEVVLAYADVPDDRLLAEVDALGAAALSVAEVAGAAGMAGLGEVARGIYLLVEAVRKQGFWNPQAVRVHLHALALLNKPGLENDQGLAMHLHAMRNTLGVGE